MVRVRSPLTVVVRCATGSPPRRIGNEQILGLELRAVIVDVVGTVADIRADHIESGDRVPGHVVIGGRELVDRRGGTDEEAVAREVHDRVADLAGVVETDRRVGRLAVEPLAGSEVHHRP